MYFVYCSLILDTMKSYSMFIIKLYNVIIEMWDTVTPIRGQNQLQHFLKKYQLLLQQNKTLQFSYITAFQRSKEKSYCKATNNFVNLPKS